ncbi:hypothetical protein KFU94_09290 [Chloroflexi bacterium TSY]|nr:hypothetical protein [Chloroflexi bacterium TSY]
MSARLWRIGQPGRRKPFPTHIIVFLAPAIIIYGFFMIYPLFDSLRLGFYTQVTRDVEQFVGIENYQTLITDEIIWRPQFVNALQNSFIFLGWFILGGQLGLHFCKEKRCLYFLI